MPVFHSMPVLAVPGERELGHCDLPRHPLKIPLYKWGWGWVCTFLSLYTGVFQEECDLLLPTG